MLWLRQVIFVVDEPSADAGFSTPLPSLFNSLLIRPEPEVFSGSKPAARDAKKSWLRFECWILFQSQVPSFVLSSVFLTLSGPSPPSHRWREKRGRFGPWLDKDQELQFHFFKCVIFLPTLVIRPFFSRSLSVLKWLVCGSG